MRYLQKCVFILLSVFLVGCGGSDSGGGGGGTASISLSVSQITASTYQNDVYEVDVTVNYQGEGVLVGMPKGVNDVPPWLGVQELSINASQAVFRIYLSGNVEAGAYNSVLRFVTAYSNGSIAYKDVPITFTIKEPIIFTAVSGKQNVTLETRLSVSDTGPVEGNSTYIAYKTFSEGEWLDVEVVNNQYQARILTTDVTVGEHVAYIEFLDENYTFKKVKIIYIVTEPELHINHIERFTLDNETIASELEFSTPITTTSEGLIWQISDASQMLIITENTDNIIVELSLELLSKENGVYPQWIEFEYHYHDLVLPKKRKIEFDLVVDFTDIEQISPYVLYTDKETTARVWGQNLMSLTEEDFKVFSPLIQSVDYISDNEVEIHLQTGSEEQNISFAIDNRLNHKRGEATVIVRPVPTFPVAAVDLPARPSSKVIYDSERERFYFRSYSNWVDSLTEISHDNHQWVAEKSTEITPRGLAIIDNGKTLLTATQSCSMYGMDLDTKQGRNEVSPEYCGYMSLGFIGQYYTGETIVANTNQWSTVYTYPKWELATESYPNLYSPNLILSKNGTHLILAESTGISSPREAYIYDVRKQKFHRLDTKENDDYYLESFSISANGERSSYQNAIYNHEALEIGRVGMNDDTWNRTFVSPDGAYAAHYDFSEKQIEIYDIQSNEGAFFSVGSTLSVNEEAPYITEIQFSEDNRYIFVFSSEVVNDVYKMYVYER